MRSRCASQKPLPDTRLHPPFTTEGKARKSAPSPRTASPQSHETQGRASGEPTPGSTPALGSARAPRRRPRPAVSPGGPAAQPARAHGPALPPHGPQTPTCQRPGPRHLAAPAPPSKTPRAPGSRNPLGLPQTPAPPPAPRTPPPVSPRPAAELPSPGMPISARPGSGPTTGPC